MRIFSFRPWQRLFLLAFAVGISAAQAAQAQVSSGGVYRVVNQCGNKVLDVSGRSLANGAAVHQWTNFDSPNQQWKIESTSDGFYKLTAGHSGKALDVVGAATANGTAVHQWNYGGGLNQQWKIVSAGSGYYKLQPRHAASGSSSSKALDVSGASTANGAKVQIWADNGTCAQRWRLEPVGGTIPNDAFNVQSPANGATVAGTIQITGQAGAQWVNVAAYDAGNGNRKISADVSPANGAYSIALNTTQLASGAAQVAVIAFSVPAGQPSGISSRIDLSLNVNNSSPNANQRFGMSNGIDSLRWLTDAQLNALLDDYQSLGVQWLRVDVPWSVIQNGGPNSYDWSTTDRVFNGARSRSIKILGVFNWTPAWARPAGAPGTSPPTDVNTFANFVKQAALRYAPLGIHHWEIWNEPNLSGSWYPAPDVNGYVNLLKAAYPAIKSADPTATVVSGGLSPVPSTDSAHLSAVSFVSSLYSLGARDYMDAVGFHPYTWPEMPSTPNNWNGWQIMAYNSTSIRSIMVANGDSAKQIWITEYGAPTNRVSEQAQAAMMQEAYDLQASYSWAGPLFWYSYRDLGTDADNSEHFFGILRHDYSRKPAYYKYLSLTQP